jgi:hypothetical protein
MSPRICSAASRRVRSALRASRKLAIFSLYTFEKAGEKVTRSACTLRSNAFVLSHDAVPGRPLTLLHQIPQFVINNSKVWDALDDPFSFRDIAFHVVYKGCAPV